jgi:G:T-mismatch repair DNA endonuclease (very short patch repair protein)
LVTRELRKAGWRVVRVWEHALVPREVGRTLARLFSGPRRPRCSGSGRAGG